MQPCEYVNVTKCAVCEIPFHAQCKKFLQVHAKALMKKLLERGEIFKFEPVKDVENYNVIYSRKADVAKSIALQFALQKNMPVIPYTSSVAMDMVTRKMEINAVVVYLHVKMAMGDRDTIIGMLESFCDWVESNGGKVAVFLDNCQAYSLKYKCVENGKIVIPKKNGEKGAPEKTEPDTEKPSDKPSSSALNKEKVGGVTKITTKKHFV